MIVQPTFDCPGRWYRGNLHTHTTRSDGRLTPRDTVEFYRHNGYDFLAVTDHRVGADLGTLETTADFLVLPGIEVDGVDPESGPYHIVGLGAGLTPDQTLAGMGSLQADVNRLRKFGMSVYCAHPHWSGQTAYHLARIDGPFGVEIYNTGCDVECDKGYGMETWDQLLAGGRRLWGLAVDDAHFVPGVPDAGGGWVMVKAQELTADAILDALRRGRFYSTQGPSIRDLRVEDGEVTITASPASSLGVIGDRWLSSVTHDSTTPPGMTRARFKLRGGETYLRGVVVGGSGRRAWSNPIFLD